MRRPTPDEIENCRRLQLTLRDDWDSYHLKLRWSGMIVSATPDSSTTCTDPISLELMSSSLMERASSHQILHMKQIGARKPHNQLIFTILRGVSSRESNSLTPEQLSRIWQIGLKTAKNTILATTHKCIRSTGMQARRFKTDKSQVRCKQLSRHYGTFYVDFLKVNVKSLRGYVGGILYCNKLGFKKFFPCINET